ncbi:MAG: hypothetical protein U0V54_15145 [Saprospiraceae bacterium]|nr:hypothetical protein [Saprospiraceae bacterium]
MRFLLGICLLLLISCSKRDEDSCNSQGFEGSWVWDKSVGGIGGWTDTPQSTGKSIRLEIDDLTFKWIENETLKINQQYDFNLSDKPIFGTEEKTYVALSDGTNFSVELKGDSLVLIDWCYDCYYHHFHRK